MIVEVSPHPARESLRLVEEISHRVLNEYAEAISSLRVAASLATGAPAREVLRSAADRLRSHADTHRALLPPVDGLVDLADQAGRFCAALVKSALAARCIRLAVEADDVWLEADRAWRVTLILAELVRNAARHGLKGGPGTILVRISREPGRITCHVLDNGGSLSGPKLGRGLGLARALADELGGTVDWSFRPVGCLAVLRIPGEAPAYAC